MTDIFFTADNHFEHDSIRTPCQRPFASLEEMNQSMTEIWNAIVGKQDLVYIIGDFAFNRHGYFQNALNGRKVLVKGDHDKMSQRYLANFSEVYDLKKLNLDKQMLFLCHWPMRSWPGSVHGSWHFYGHSHGTSSESDASKSCDVGVDVWNYQPVPWEVLKSKMSVKKDRVLRTREQMAGARDELRMINSEWLKLRESGK